MSHSCSYPKSRQVTLLISCNIQLKFATINRFSDRFCDLQREPLLNKLVYFLRSNPKGVSDKTYEQDIVAGELSKETLDNYGTLLSELYLPVFKEQGNWGKSDTEHTHQFLQVSTS